MSQPSDPTTTGSGSAPPTKPRDVFDYVRRELAASKPPGDAGIDSSVDEFIDLARKLFSENCAVAQDTMSETLAIRFQDGTVLTFCDVPHGIQGVGGQSGAMSITATHPPRGNDGRGQSVASLSWGVSSGELGNP